MGMFLRDQNLSLIITKCSIWYNLVDCHAQHVSYIENSCTHISCVKHHNEIVIYFSSLHNMRMTNFLNCKVIEIIFRYESYWLCNGKNKYIGWSIIDPFSCIFSQSLLNRHMLLVIFFLIQTLKCASKTEKHNTKETAAEAW